MLRLYDPETEARREVVPAHPRLLRLRARGGLRAYVVVDTIRRLAEHRKLRVMVDSDAGDDETLGELNVYRASGERVEPVDLDVLTGAGEPGVGAARTVRLAGLAVDPVLLGG